jgi:hypothetical protein
VNTREDLRTSPAAPDAVLLAGMLDEVRGAPPAGPEEPVPASSAHRLWTDLLGDLVTVLESTAGSGPVSCCLVMDGRRRYTQALLRAGVLLGLDMRLAAPRALWPPEDLVVELEDIARDTGAGLLVTSDPGHAVLGADVVCADGVASAPGSFRVDGQFLADSGKAGTRLLRCPAEDECAPGPRQAENRRRAALAFDLP